jgi:hypothetical protein
MIYYNSETIIEIKKYIFNEFVMFALIVLSIVISLENEIKSWNQSNVGKTEKVRFNNLCYIFIYSISSICGFSLESNP